jgi:ferredoxin-NADP reductase
MKIFLKDKKQLSQDIFEFVFTPEKEINWISGQFLQYYIDCKDDTRGSDRFFTITSSPLEKDILLTTRFSIPGSMFKQKLKDLKIGESISAEGPWGKFVLDNDYESKKLFFIAGGIGITPFRSIIKDFLLKKENNVDITLLYYNKTDKFIYRDEFDNSFVKTYYQVGSMSMNSLKDNIVISTNSLYYVSGPEGFVKNTEDILINQLNIPKTLIKTDFFPGYTSV